MSSSKAVTRGVSVQVESRFLPGPSQPELGRWLFAYRIRIANDGDERVQLISRHWIIEDGEGRVEQVRGPGVVGCQPDLAPGEAFEYQSFCPLPTSYGSMRGTFQMVTHSGDAFDAEVAEFRLDEMLAYN